MELQTIGQVSKTLDVSTRTLRYYEQIGLIISQKQGTAAYRMYDREAIRRLQQIIVLRKLRVPLTAIGAILNSGDARVAIDLFRQNIAEIEGEMAALNAIRRILNDLVARLRASSGWPAGLLTDAAIERAANALLPSRNNFGEDATMEELNRAEKKLGKLNDVRILYLPPATVAASHFIGENPEHNAGARLDEFVCANALAVKKPDLRMYGFNHPNPSADRPDYGYEFWVTIPDDMDVPAPLIKKRFPGGLYAAHVIAMGNFHEWEWLWAWAHDNPDYDPNILNDGGECMHGLLEEHLNYRTHVLGDNPRPDTMQLDLLIPIKPKSGN